MSKGWDNVDCLESSDKRVKKYIFTKEDAIAEAVLYKYPTYEDRTVMCISTQTGCPMGCTFCGTGKFFGRNLTTSEMMRQVKHMVADNDIDLNSCKKSQIMFMSMGEPLFNMDMLVKACHVFDQWYPDTQLLVSTSAPFAPASWNKLLTLAIESPNIGVQFSVHESVDYRRDKIMPYPKKYNLEGIARLGEQFYDCTGRKPFFNYCVHKDNATRHDAINLWLLFNPLEWEATLSVICDPNGKKAQHDLDLLSEFSTRLVNHGFNVRVFDPAGQDDVGGGCGQLWQVQEFAKHNPTLNRKKERNHE